VVPGLVAALPGYSNRAAYGNQSAQSGPARPGFEHDHHGLLAMAAPRPSLLIGGRRDSEDSGGDSDDRESCGYYNRAKETYRLLGVPDRLQFVLKVDGHQPDGPEVDAEWRAFLDRWLRPKPAPMPQTYLRYLEEGMGRVEAGMVAHREPFSLENLGRLTEHAL
jgi:hypothetical protein